MVISICILLLNYKNIQMNRVFLGLGGNIGDLMINFKAGKKLIGELCGEILHSSSLYHTPPLGFQAENYFLNQVIEIESALTPEILLEKILGIEALLGRNRKKGEYTSRTFDIDILYFNDLVLSNNDLIIPHPRLPERKFVLVPLVEIAPDFLHPLLDKTNRQLLEICPDDSDIRKVQAGMEI